ncbi:gamma-glutamyl-gamma-aminobutyrate hydrolase family protein [Pseudomonas pergaminensis]|uniref:Gamma-glutamyl-gamma-aminobutyrate hydrolase family protein n=1 Tax=Pseudomonas pergaminensis TaxID=2853159 RepID=A0ABD7TN23_9PSED|nr:gamma-glutamyl-gamma-aminobutyrate hydrolase family protein [Pseudomonas pergaminensis]USW02758.1 gamma-glutamyl-gamma-aminobutyrate hydrolase family protein [Pseudomonas pergaminensis]
MRVAITQRVERIPGYAEQRDCLDQRWTTLMEELGIDLVPVPNGMSSVDGWFERQNIAGLVLSGGNDLTHLPGAANASPERDKTETTLLSKAMAMSLPVLAVCRGMQMLNHFLGGSLTRLSGHANGAHAIFVSDQTPLMGEYREVNSFHTWGIQPEDLAENLLAQAWAHDGSIEAFIHTQLPWTAIMWHPERPSANPTRDAKLIRQLFFSKDTPCV